MRFDGMVFAGGGCRCFWQAGFWASAAPRLAFRPRVLAGVSAGAAFATAAAGGVLEAVVDDFRRRTAANRRNFYARNLVRREPAFPHNEMYRSTILATMGADVLERVKAGPEIRVQITRPPRYFGAKRALVMGFAAYELDRRLKGGVHPRWPRRLGFRSEVVSVQSCSTPQDLADLILHSSCMPPITPLFRRGGEVVLDGAVVDSAPVELIDDCESQLVLLTKQFGDVPRGPTRLYVQPSEPVPIQMWDYASPDLITRTYDLGRRDGEAFAREAATAESGR